MGFQLKIDIIANKTDHEASPGCTSRQGKNLTKIISHLETSVLAFKERGVVVREG